MPMYRFICQECKETFEQRLAVTELDQKCVQCPHGHQNVQRLFNAPTIIFKGSGWYSKDHAKSGK
jgi:putative FmdB family regulatory protein